MRRLGLLRTVVGTLDRFLPGGETVPRRVYGVALRRAVKDGWESRILEMADGKTLGHITAALLMEEVRAGAWLADIGVLHDLFAEQVVKVVTDLERRGFVHIRPKRDTETALHDRVDTARPSGIGARLQAKQDTSQEKVEVGSS